MFFIMWIKRYLPISTSQPFSGCSARGKLHLHEFSFMSGDFVAALILLDFLYLVLADEGAKPWWHWWVRGRLSWWNDGETMGKLWWNMVKWWVNGGKWWWNDVNGHDSGTDWGRRYRFHIFLAYFSGLCKGISLENMALYGTVPPF